MPSAAPRLDPRLVERLDQLARTSESIAEIRRILVRLARRLEVPPPSYEHVRRLVHARRAMVHEKGTAEIFVEALVGARPASDFARSARGERVR